MDDVSEFRDCAGCVCAGVRRAARVVTQHYNRKMRATGLRGTQFSVLTSLARRGPMPVSRLAAYLGVERTTLTRNLRPMATKGWIEIGDSKDRRVRAVAITASGRAMARAALPAWREAQATVGPTLKESRLAQLLAAAE
ncbi:MAG: MarR family winged helix-turn-helix transcriptional regulator [Stellaceae bacterium]